MTRRRVTDRTLRRLLDAIAADLAQVAAELHARPDLDPLDRTATRRALHGLAELASTLASEQDQSR